MIRPEGGCVPICSPLLRSSLLRTVTRMEFCSVPFCGSRFLVFPSGEFIGFPVFLRIFPCASPPGFYLPGTLQPPDSCFLAFPWRRSPFFLPPASPCQQFLLSFFSFWCFLSLAQLVPSEAFPLRYFSLPLTPGSREFLFFLLSGGVRQFAQPRFPREPSGLWRTDGSFFP